MTAVARWIEVAPHRARSRQGRYPPAACTAAASSSLVIFDRPGMSNRCAILYSSARVASVDVVAVAAGAPG